MKIELIVATKNKKKLKEIRKILKGLDLKISSLLDLKNIPRIIENGKTFKDNAAKKALKISCFTKKLTLGEDSGLCVDALGGKPGIYSSRFSGKNKSDAKNNEKLIRLLKNYPVKKRGAHYVCAVAIAGGDGLLGLVEGRCYGYIGFKLKGRYGFGYDPLFVIQKYKKTFGQLGPKIKHRISHRYKALKKARQILQKYIVKHRCN